jgi:hypothetical protein
MYTITDAAEPPGLYTLAISYDNGSSWFDINTMVPIGPGQFDPTTELPSVQASTTCILRATNNDTAATALSDVFELDADTVTFDTFTSPGPQTVDWTLKYVSDNTTATLTSGNPASTIPMADTDAGTEGADATTCEDGEHWSADFSNLLVVGGNFTLTANAGVVFDRVASVLNVPVTILIP